MAINFGNVFNRRIRRWLHIQTPSDRLYEAGVLAMKAVRRELEKSSNAVNTTIKEMNNNVG